MRKTGNIIAKSGQLVGFCGEANDFKKKEKMERYVKQTV